MVIVEMKIPREGTDGAITGFGVDVEDAGDDEVAELFLLINEKMLLMAECFPEVFIGSEWDEWPVSGPFIWLFEDFKALFRECPLLQLVDVFKDKLVSIDDGVLKCLFLKSGKSSQSDFEGWAINKKDKIGDY